MKHHNALPTLALIATSAAATCAQAALVPISYADPASTYTENFNVGTTSAYIATSTIPGFSAYVSGGGNTTNTDVTPNINYADAQTIETIRRNTAYGNSQAITITSQRASTVNYLTTTGDGQYNAFGLTFKNDTGAPISQLQLAFDTFTSTTVNNTSGPDGVDFSYGFDNADLADASATWTAVPELSFSYGASPSPSTGAVSATLTGLTWAPGQTITLRWKDVNKVGASDRAFGVDNVSLSVPEPTSLAALALAGAGLSRRRRRA